MPLRDIVTPRTTIPAGGSSFAVRGLAFTDMKVLFAHHVTEVNGFFNFLNELKKNGKIDEAAAGQVAIDLLQQFPAMAASAIALAADEPESVDVVLGLPFPLQIETVMEIGRLTFGTEGGLKKFLQTVGTIAAQYQQALGQAKQPNQKK